MRDNHLDKFWHHLRRVAMNYQQPRTPGLKAFVEVSKTLQQETEAVGAHSAHTYVSCWPVQSRLCRALVHWTYFPLPANHGSNTNTGYRFLDPFSASSRAGLSCSRRPCASTTVSQHRKPVVVSKKRCAPTFLNRSNAFIAEILVNCRLAD